MLYLQDFENKFSLSKFTAFSRISKKVCQIWQKLSENFAFLMLRISKISSKLLVFIKIWIY
ncbi:MAG: hypothetical protein C4287_23150 [Leptolyngbya sp. ERB_1_2]